MAVTVNMKCLMSDEVAHSRFLTEGKESRKAELEVLGGCWGPHTSWCKKLGEDGLLLRPAAASSKGPTMLSSILGIPSPRAGGLLVRKPIDLIISLCCGIDTPPIKPSFGLSYLL